MRDYGKFCTETWVDFEGSVWPVIQSSRRLKFKYPAHAALRRHIFHRDGFRCVHCGAHAIDIPENYDGKNALSTNTFVSSGYRDTLILDHMLTLKAGGKSVIENLQSLCETCNKRKIKHDCEDVKKMLGGA